MTDSGTEDPVQDEAVLRYVRLPDAKGKEASRDPGNETGERKHLSSLLRPFASVFNRTIS